MVKSNKKANAVLDSITVVVVIIAFALVSLIGYEAFDNVNTDIQADSDFSQTAKDTSNNVYMKYASLMDSLFLLAFVLMIIFTVISSFMLDSHPIFFVITLVLLVFAFIVGIYLANTYDDFASDPTYVSYANQFPYIHFITNNLLTVIITIGFMISISLYLKFKG